MNLFQQIGTWYSTRKTNKIRQRLLLKHSVNFNGFGGLVVANQVVSEFGYLLRFITDGLVSDFDDLRKSKVNAAKRVAQIAIESDKQILSEQATRGLARATAVGNMANLRKVVRCIEGYVADCDAAGIDLSPPEQP